MNKEYLEALEELRDFRYGKDKLLVCQTEMYSIIKKALTRLESIDNANPSKALECLGKIKEDFGCDMAYYDLNIEYETVEQALIKAQEPKHYLKWEDLDFSFKEKYMKVKLNGNIYTLRYTRNGVMDFPVAYLEFNNTEITIIDCKKQFFNDLHLERVEDYE